MFPSRGEGFGLPLAEAMALGKPVIATAYGGQSDFCDGGDKLALRLQFRLRGDASWRVQFRLARTRRGIAGPDHAGCARGDARRTCRESEAGQARILADYTWDRVAERTRTAIALVRQPLRSGDLRLPTIGVISTWNSRCGIADYTRSLVSGIEPERLRVFANKGVEVLGPDESFVRRCWAQGWDDKLEDLYQEIRAASIDAAVFQFNFGFFRLSSLAWLCERLRGLGIPVFITFHSTMDVVKPDITIRLSEITETLAHACRLLVHSVHDLNRLKAIGLVENVTLFPMGLPVPFTGDREAKRRSLGLENKTIIASFGYLCRTRDCVS